MSGDLRFKINAPHVVHEIFEDREAAIINLKSGNYYSLDPLGAFVWAHVEAGASMSEIVQQILLRYEGESGEVGREIGRFLEALQAEELIVAATDAGAQQNGTAAKVAGGADGVKTAFAPPVLERYNDMQELLLLDPIHEVDDTGWPNRKRED